jgi:hypothetical protein
MRITLIRVRGSLRSVSVRLIVEEGGNTAQSFPAPPGFDFSPSLEAPFYP